jgi:glycosyltransferase involved in cell wall biosynthesis
MHKLTMVIPLYNDLDSALSLIDLIGDCSDEKNVSFLLVDNGSEEIGLHQAVISSGNDNLRYLRVETNQGFGGGILAGIMAVSSSHVGWMPGNLKVTPQDAIRLWATWTINREFSAVKASRQRVSKVDALKTHAAGLLASVVHGARLFDSGGTPTMTDTEFMKNLVEKFPRGYDFEVFTLLAMRRSGVRILRPKVQYLGRRYGSSHWQTSLGAELTLLGTMLRNRRLWRVLLTRRR